MRFSARLITGLCIALLTCVTLEATVEDKVSAEHGVAAGRDIRGSTITIGYTFKEVQQLIQAGTQELRTTYQAQVNTLSQRLAVTEEAIIGFFAILKREAVPPEQLTETLAKIAQRHREMLDRLTVLDSDDPAVKTLISEVRAALAASDYDRADLLLHQAEAADLSAARQAQTLAEQARAVAARRLLNAAVARAARGEISLTRLHYREAANHFQAASAMVPESHPMATGIYLRRYADALSEYGEKKGDNVALRQAIAAYREVLAVVTRDQVPLEWATTQTNLGTALAVLGERESGTAHLEAAVAAFREALKERTRDREPLLWAMTQNNLGNALASRGERESDTAHLEAAVAAFREALEEQTRKRVPLAWAKTQTNLGVALAMLGERESGTARLEDAVAAFLAALEENTHDRVPLEWAGTQNNLGFTLWRLGEREAGTARLEAAVVAYGEALKEYTREQVPLEWARTQANLGLALATLGERESDTVRLRQAEAAMQSAYAVYQEAGYDHYNDDFEERLRWLRQWIEADRNADSPRKR